MADDKRMEVQIGADTGEATAGVNQVAAQFQQFAKQTQDAFKKMGEDVSSSMKSMQSQLKSHFDGISSAISLVGKAALGVGAVLAGGAWFKGMIEDTIEYVGAAKKLSDALNVNINEAAALNHAYRRVGLDADTLLQVLRRFQIQIRTNSEDMKQYGLDIDAIRARGGGLLEMFEKSKEIVESHTKGYDRNQAAMVFWGARVQDVNKILRVHAVDVAGAKKFLEGLGLTIGPEMERQIRQFKTGLVDMDTVFLAIKFTIAKEIMPHLIKLGQWASGEGKTAIEGLAAVIRVTGNAFYYMGEGISFALRAAEGVGAVHGILPEIPTPTAASAGPYGEAAETFFGDLEGEGQTFEPPTGGGGGTSIVQQWQQEWEERQLLENKFLESSLAAEREFWLEKLALCAEGSKEYKEVNHRVFQLTKAVEREAYRERLADLRLQLEEERRSGQERMKVMDAMLLEAKRHFGEESKEYKNLQREKTRLARQTAEELRRLEIADLGHQKTLGHLELDMERQKYRFRRELGQISEAQELAAERRLLQQKYALDRQEMLQTRAKYMQSEKEFKEWTHKIEILDKQHQLNMQKIDQQYFLALRRQFDQVLGIMKGAFTSFAVALFAQGTKLKDALNSLWQALLSGFVSMLADLLFQWVAGLLFGRLLGILDAIKKIGTAATVAAANTFAWWCLVNPVIAPAMAEAAYVKTLAFGTRIPAAAGGWDLPRNLGPAGVAPALLHPEETVLPADLAAGFRELIRRGFATGSAQILRLHQEIPIEIIADGKTLLKTHKRLVFDIVQDGLDHRVIRVKK